MTGGLSILQWNCRTINGKVPHLLRYLRDHPGTHILALQSLNVGPRALPLLDNFYPPIISTEKGRVQTALYVSSSLTYADLATPNDLDRRLLSCGATIQMRGGKNINVVSIYYPGGHLRPEDVTWLTELDTDQHSWIILGDFNSSHSLWDNEATAADDASDCLADTLTEADLCILNDGSFTHIAPDHQRSRAIDISLATPDLARNATWTTASDHLQSDHLPIHIDLHHYYPTQTGTPPPRFQTDRANWSLFQSLLLRECAASDPREQDIEAYYDNIRGMILRAANASIPLKAPAARGKHYHTSLWWNEACEEATAAKRYALRSFQRDKCTANKQALLAATKTCEEVTTQAMASHWEKFCAEEVRGPHDSTTIWRKVARLRRRARKPECPLNVKGSYTKTDHEKAEALANCFAKASQTAHLPDDLKDIRGAAEKNMPSPSLQDDDNLSPQNSDITLDEVRSILSSLSTKSKATGPDPISYHILRHLPESMIQVLHAFYQECWTRGVIPAAWRRAEVIAIHKDGKPRGDPASYRPIALTPHLGKIYEKILNNRLSYHVEKHNLLPKAQAGFRTGRGCMEHVVSLVEGIKHGWSKCHRKRTAGAFFDIKRAFDTVWHAKLLNKLHSMGINGRLHKFIATFLSDRTIQVRVGAATSNPHSIDMGVPQGSVIAPLLFCLMLSDIEKVVTDPSQEISLYADDLAIWASYDKQTAEKCNAHLQRTVAAVNDYMRENGFQLAADKTVLMVFTTSRLDLARFNIQLNGHTIRPSKSVKFLGVTLTSSLSWTNHINNLISKAKKGVNLIKLLTREKWATPRSLIHLVQALVRSRLMYGHEAFCTAPASLWMRLQRIEVAALKHALGVPMRAKNDLIYQEAGWLPLREECRRLAANLETRLKATHNTALLVEDRPTTTRDTAARRFRMKKKPQLHFKTKSLHSTTEILWTESGSSPAEVTPAQTNHFPHWIQKHPDIITDYDSTTSKKDNPNYLASLAKEKICTSFPNHLKIYTDGSLHENGSAGSAMVIPALNITKRSRLNKGIDNFSAELHAIHTACSTIIDLPSPPFQVLILSDSKAALLALKSIHPTSCSRSDLVSEIQLLAHHIICKGTDLTLLWIPSHVGIRGNDQADQAANSARVSGRPTQLPLSPGEIKAKLRKAAYKLRDDHMKQKCEDNGWIFIPSSHKRPSPTLPRRNLRLLYRIRTGCQLGVLNNLHCLCGGDPTLQHLLSGCPALSTAATSPLLDLKHQHHLTTPDFLSCHQTLGLTTVKTLTDCILSAGITNWF